MGRKITKLPRTAQLPTHLRVAAYARVSSGKDEMLHSLAAQVSYYSNLIQGKPEWEYVGVYADEAETGTKDSRPEFRRLIADCRAGRIDLVLTKSISRFARNTVTLLETVRELKDLDVGVFFEEQNLHSLSGDGELMLTILASYAQEESRSASENQKWRIRKDFKEGRPSNNIRIYGFDYKDFKLTIIPEEADVVRMIFDDYLSGLGKNAIMKKLIRLEIPTKCGGRWSESTVGSILKNEKYIGDTCLQKGFIIDHLTKQWKSNDGELPKYYVEGSHEAIIDRETFEAVQTEMAQRAAKANHPRKLTFSEFSGLITCERCGAKFRKKVNGTGTKYAKVVWACATYTYRGKHECAAKRIPEDILKEKCAEVLGLVEYDPAEFTAKVTAITIPDDGVLVFTFKDGSEQALNWENRSRRESWSDEMKQAARERALGGADNG
ncbi:MAG: recombinase family protein [Christensenellales bacterium]|jgi:site-specific DNA recombinase